MYKVCSTFDSTDAGNIGPVADALGRQGARRLRSGDAGLSGDRTDCLSRSPVRRLDALEREPAQGSSAQSDARFQSRAGVAAAVERIRRPHRPHDCRTGSARVSRARAELSAQGYGTAIVDAVFERDLEALGDAAAESTFSVGASGLGSALRARWRGGRSTASTQARSKPLAEAPRSWRARAPERRSSRSRRLRTNSGAPLFHAKADRGSWRDRSGAGLGERAHRVGPGRLSPRAKSPNRSLPCKRATAETSPATRSNTRWPRSRPDSWA